MIDTRQVREASLLAAKALDYPTNPNLPLIDSDVALRPLDEIVDRMLVLLAVVASTYSFGPARARDYLMQENLWQAASPDEHAFLAAGKGDKEFFQNQVEALAASAWAIGVLAELPFDQVCSEELVHLLPDMSISAPSAPFRQKAKLRPLKEIVAADDLAYCLHWALRKSQIAGERIPGKVHPNVIVERRRALHWILSDDDWDAVPLDT